MAIDGSWTALESYPGYVSAEQMQAVLDFLEQLSAGLGTGVEGSYSTVKDRLAAIEARIPPIAVVTGASKIDRALPSSSLPLALLTGSHDVDLSMSDVLSADVDVTGGPVSFTISDAGYYVLEAGLTCNQGLGGNCTLGIYYGGVAHWGPVLQTGPWSFSTVANGVFLAASTVIKATFSTTVNNAGSAITSAYLKCRPVSVA